MSRKTTHEWTGITRDDLPEPKEFPKVTIVIPTYNCSQFISHTIETILKQDYENFEVIVIDANSCDRTLEIVKSYYDKRLRICSVPAYNRYEMMNKGISLSKGIYINFLFPGDFYLHDHTIYDVIRMAEEYDFPHLIYGACLIRGGMEDSVEVLFRTLSIETLRKGQQPTSIQTCWIHAESFRVIGKFSTEYAVRGGYDLFCRFRLYSPLRVISTKRVLVDYTQRPPSKRSTLNHFTETLRIIYLYFGWWDAFKWLFIQKDISRLFRLWKRSVKTAFLGERSA